MKAEAENGKALPLPPRYLWRKGVWFEAMTETQCEYWLGLYNGWVELWNVHERSRDLPLSPRWREAEHVWWTDPQMDGVITFSPYGQEKGRERMGWIRPEARYRHWVDGWSCCRVQAEGRVKWAGWANGFHESFFEDHRRREVA